MKTRQGFVSNSSSSSFLIMGLEVEKEKIKSLTYEQIKELVTRFDNISYYEERICCGKTLKTEFCPFCGKSKKDVEPKMNMEKLIDGLISEDPPTGYGFFDSPEGGIYYCTSIGGSLSDILKEKGKFWKAASILCDDFPETTTEEWLNDHLIIDGGEYYNG